MNSANQFDDKRRNDRLREDLSRRRDELYERVKALRRDQSEEMLMTPGDVMDVAKSSTDVDTHASIIEALERQLAEIDDALTRVEQSQYGVCQNCGEEIPAERLKAVPSAIYCVDCQAIIGAVGGTARIARGEAYARWTPPPEADQNEALSDKGVNSLDELSLRRERAENKNIEPDQPAAKRGAARTRPRAARSRPK